MFIPETLENNFRLGLSVTFFLIGAEVPSHRKRSSVSQGTRSGVLHIRNSDLLLIYDLKRFSSAELNGCPYKVQGKIFLATLIL